MIKKKGQVLVEFALILPLFLLLVFGIFYSGMLFYDYSTLSNVARSAAREAAIKSNVTENDSEIIGNYYNSQNNAFSGGLITSLYSPKAGEAFLIHIEENENAADDIIVTITMIRNNKFVLMDALLPDDYQIKYHMRKDN